jgi:hypothetical protein
MKISFVLCLLTFSLILAGCGSTGGGKSVSPGATLAKRLGLSEAEHSGMDAMFTALEKALREKKGAEVGRHFDVARMLEACEEQGMNLKELGAPKQMLAAVMQIAIGPQIVQQADMMLWEEYEIRRVQFHKGREEAMVRTRMRDADGLVTDWVWWLAWRDGRWRIFDYEDVTTNLRISVIMTAVLAEGGAGMAWKDDFMALMGIAQAVFAGDLDAADEILEGIRDTKFPPMIEGARWLMTAAVRAAQEKFRDALRACDIAESHNPNMTGIPLMRLNAYIGLGKFKDALDHGKKYLAVAGPDPDVLYSMAVAHELLGNEKEAEKFYRAGLADDPQSTDCLAGLAVLLPEKRKKEFLPYFHKLKKTDAAFETLAETFIEVEDAAALRLLLDAYRVKSTNQSALEKIQEYEAKYKELTKPAKVK